MQKRPSNWTELFSSAHKTEYRFVIDGKTYQGKDLKGTPTIAKPLLNKPGIGAVCTGSLSLTIYPHTSVDNIPKAAPVEAYCRLVSPESGMVTDWIPQGKYYVNSRKGEKLVQLSCLDSMIKTGTTYLDKSHFTQWPVPMADVVAEIAAIMGVGIDARTEIRTEKDYAVSYPNEDMLISEVLGMIAAAHGGNWIMNEAGELRLVPFLSADDTEIGQDLGKLHTGYKSLGTTRTISCVCLIDDAKNEFAAGDDTGVTLMARCNYATQTMADALCSERGIQDYDRCIIQFDATARSDCVTIESSDEEKDVCEIQDLGTPLYGAEYIPYMVSGAYLDPCLELGDTIAVTDREDVTHYVVIQTVKMFCTVACTCDLSANTDEETENEYPYVSAAELTLERTVRSDQTYFGNRITRAEGFVSELLINGTAAARLTANASVFAMQSYDEKTKSWTDALYFDTKSKKYTITGDVTVNGMVTITDLATSGSTIINGDNITTGTIAANRIDLSDYSTTEEVTKKIASTFDGLQISVKATEKNHQTTSTITLSKGSTEISNAVVVGTTAAQVSSIANDAISGIKLEVTNSGKTSTLKLSANGATLSSGTISFTGFVTFTDLAESGSTTINGSNITTGTISAERIDTTDLRLTTLYTKANNKYHLAVTADDRYVYIGGDGASYASSDITLRCSTQVHFSSASMSRDTLIVNTAGNLVAPGEDDQVQLGNFLARWRSTWTSTLNVGNSANYVWINETGVYYASTGTPMCLGSDERPWHNAVIGANSIKIGTSTNSLVGFYGHYPTSQQFLGYSYATESNYLAAITQIMNILRNLGLCM